MEKEVIKTKKQVKEFLDEIKKVDMSQFHIIQRFKEPEKDPYRFMLKLEYDLGDTIEEIYNLTYEDYLRCQIDDKNNFGFMYNFIKVIKEYIVYIKLSIVEEDNEVVYVISFHEAEINELHKRPFRR